MAKAVRVFLFAAHHGPHVIAHENSIRGIPLLYPRYPAIPSLHQSSEYLWN